MQKLPEDPDRKRVNACAKKELSQQKKEACSLSAVTSGVTTLKSFLLLVEGTMRLLTFPLVAVISFTNEPQLKAPNNGLIKITIKTYYNRFND